MAAESPQVPTSEEDALSREQMLATIDELRAENEKLGSENKALQSQLKVALEKLQEFEQELLQLKKKVTGRTTEKTATTSRRKKYPRDKNDAKATAKRRGNRDKRTRTVPTEDIEHPVSDGQRSECERCGGSDVQPMGYDPPSTEWVYQPGQLVRARHHREKVRCNDCGHIVRAEGPARVVDQGSYDAGFIAETIVRKISNCLPFYRQAKMWLREGCPVARSTMSDLFHCAAELLSPLYLELVKLVVAAYVVYADETSLKMQRVKKLGFIWTFASEEAVTYVYAADRSGETPVRILGESEGLLVVDGYSGYNKICTPEGRLRAGCCAHSRRKFVDLDDDGARFILEKYEEVWDVEREVKEKDIVGTARHLELRRARAGPAMRAIQEWCDAHQDDYTPKSAMGKAIRYFLNQWEFLTRFLDHVEIAPDNNFSERMLRTLALGRKNWLFVGHEDAGQNLAMLASLVMSCELHDINPWQYLTDVLMRIQSHPASQIGELLPHRWKHCFGHLYEHSALVERQP